MLSPICLLLQVRKMAINRLTLFPSWATLSVLDVGQIWGWTLPQQGSREMALLAGVRELEVGASETGAADV